MTWAEPMISDLAAQETVLRQAGGIDLMKRVFAQRFYSFSQFKRSAMPNGPKVSHGGSLSPRGDWRAPSDMAATVWLAEIERDIPPG